MQPRSLNQILSELKSLSPFKSVQTSINRRLKTLPSELAADETNVLNRINRQSLQSAQNRGLAFSGIPLREAAELSAPALSDLRSNARNNRLTLEQALSQAEAGLLDTAIGLRENEVSRFEAREAERRAAERAAANARRAAAAQPSAIDGLLAQILAGGTGSTTNPRVSKEEKRYQEWLNSQLKVSTAPSRSIVPTQRRLQGSSPRLQGGRKPSKRKSTFKLQGAGALTGSGGLRVR